MSGILRKVQRTAARRRRALMGTPARSLADIQQEMDWLFASPFSRYRRPRDGTTMLRGQL